VRISTSCSITVPSSRSRARNSDAARTIHIAQVIENRRDQPLPTTEPAFYVAVGTVVSAYLLGVGAWGLAPPDADCQLNC
jgi:hypothetical protein